MNFNISLGHFLGPYKWSTGRIRLGFLDFNLHFSIYQGSNLTSIVYIILLFFLLQFVFFPQMTFFSSDQNQCFFLKDQYCASEKVTKNHQKTKREKISFRIYKTFCKRTNLANYWFIFGLIGSNFSVYKFQRIKQTFSKFAKTSTLETLQFRLMQKKNKKKIE